MKCFYLGRVPYHLGWKLQKSIVKLFKNMDIINTHCILLLEHNPVYTTGVRCRDPFTEYNEATINRLKKLGAEFVRYIRFFCCLVF